MIRPHTPEQIGDEFLELLNQARHFLLGVANDEFPAALRAKGGASDLVQETIATALRSRYQFRGSTFDDLRAWLRAILKNKLVEFHRQYVRVAARDVSREVAVEDTVPIPAEKLPALDGMIRNETSRCLSAAVSGLPEDMRAAVVLRMEQGLTFGEIGEQLERSEESARKLFTRALVCLRGAFPDAKA